MNNLNPPVSPTQQHAIISLLTQRYIHQLMSGCEDPGCLNPFCSSNPEFNIAQLRLSSPIESLNPQSLENSIDAHEVVRLASRLANVGTQHLCKSNNLDLETMGSVSSILGSATIRSPVMSISETFTASSTENTGEQYTSLNLEILKKLLDKAFLTDEWDILTRLVFNVFSSLSQLSKSFKRSTNTTSEYIFNDWPNLEARQIRQAYHSFATICPPTTSSALFTATGCLLDKIKLKQDKLETLENLGVLLLILENPLLLDSQYHNSIVGKLCEIFADIDNFFVPKINSTKKIDLDQVIGFMWVAFHTSDNYFFSSPDSHQLEKNHMDDPNFYKPFSPTLIGRNEWLRLQIHFQKYSEEWTRLVYEFQGIVSVIQHFITMRVYTASLQANGVANPSKDDMVIYATKALNIFYKVNLQLNIISFEEFYNEAVNEHLEIKEDFPHWKAKEGFSFCNYPFILTPGVKSDILKVESMVQMRHELQDSFFRAMFIGVNSPYLVLEIRRGHLIRDALYQLEKKTPQDLKKQLKIQFVGEEGVDEGGVQKEFFQLVVRELFDKKYGFFSENEETKLIWFLPSLPQHILPASVDNSLDGSSKNPDVNVTKEDVTAMEEIKLVGQLLGLAIYNGVILHVRFPMCLYKKLMGVDVGLQDLKELDPMLAKNFQTLLDFDGDVESTFSRSFQIDYECFGQVHHFDLLPNGSNIALTNENREQFVRLYVDFILNKSVHQAFTYFQRGFYNVVSSSPTSTLNDTFILPSSTSAMSLFRPEELHQLICGSEDNLDFNDLKLITTYDGGYTETTDVIVWFWQVLLEDLNSQSKERTNMDVEPLKGFNEEQKRKLLFFATGTDRVPIGGLSKMNFVIAKNGTDSDRLPTSHTCFNVLLLPEYNSKAKLKERLLTAIENAEGFGMI